MVGKFRKFLGELVFWAHVLIVIPIVGLLFVPKSLVPSIESLHFFYVLSIVVVQGSWGAIMYLFNGGHYRNVCPVTTVMQSVRGHKLNDPKNYTHSFISEFFGRYKLRISSAGVNYMLLVMVAVVVVRFFF